LLWKRIVMQVTRLDIANLRCFERASLTPGPGMNLITGANGAGKTSVLEALHLMAYGRSFRGRVHDGLIRGGASALEVFVEWREGARPDPTGSTQASASERMHRAGLRHEGQAWVGRLDGADVAHLGELCAAFAVVTAEPGSHALITGGGEPRRRFMDWGLFHVEPDFLPLWRRYARALRQRNALLKQRVGGTQLDAWDEELAVTGEPLTRHRDRYLQQLQPQLELVLASLLPGGGTSRLEFQPGWRREEVDLADALLLARERDLAAGFTSVGPHRADWRIEQAALPGKAGLSRGQAKLTALSALLAQAEHHARLRGDWPVVALDDLASELDREHQRRVLQRMLASGAQVFITGTEPPPVLPELHAEVVQFHVEQGTIHAEARP
jgi:DNA replication and repair protein RecF